MYTNSSKYENKKLEIYSTIVEVFIESTSENVY